ncbi:uncharacterized protein LOC117121356 [Anneissia japonica]|uniref:uncharacterized protein LOC117121356 n=1 Tax=Anneissia japonica TaxID=1529436 RepID=UPI0014255B0F|nr:uncharacterized protein LOC117121356 [Anneissia japonica]
MLKRMEETELSESHFNQLLVDFSRWYDGLGHINMLKVLYNNRDHVPIYNKLSEATKVMPLLSMLIGSGNLSQTNLTILYDTIKATGQFGFNSKTVPLQRIREHKVSIFTWYRQFLLKLGMHLTKEDIAEIDGRYNMPVLKNYDDSWQLILDLEQRKELCEEKIYNFIEGLPSYLALKSLLEDYSEASTSKRPMLNEGNEEPSTPKRPKLNEEEKRQEQLKQKVQDEGPPLLKNLEDELRSQYKDHSFMQVTPDEWSPHFRIVRNLVIDLIMFQYPQSGNENEAKEISIDDIATHYNKRKSNDPKRILIQGELGNGKTTLMKKLARSWADDPSKGVFGKKIVFFMELKNVQEKCFLENAIKNCLPDFLVRYDTKLEVLQPLIIKNDKNFVFLCDGYDELLPDMRSELEKVFRKKHLKNCVLVVTTRPDNMDKLVKVCDSHIKITGFKPEHQDEFINKFFENSDQGQNLIKLRKDQQYSHIFEMGKTPLFLLYLCTLWEDRGQVPPTVIELYRELLVCKVNHLLGKQEKDEKKIETFSDINEEHLNVMLDIGKITLDGLLKNRLNFKLKESADEKLKVAAIKLGLIVEERSVFKIYRNKCYTTTHKSESEFLASLYVAETMKKGSKSDIGETVKGMLSTSELSQVCKFTVALLGNEAHLFMDYFPLKHFESSALADLLDECPKDEVNIVKNSIKQHMNKVECVTINSQTGLNIVTELNNFSNADTCILDTTSATICGSNIPKALYSMTALSTLTWHGVNDDTLETLSSFESQTLSSGLGSITKLFLLGKITKENSCKNLGRFLCNMKAMESLELPVISYGPGLYMFVSAMYGHHCLDNDRCCTDRCQENNFKKLTILTFVLKKIFCKKQRNSGYAHLVSSIMALCPCLENVVIHKTNKEFEFHLFKKLSQAKAFRDITKQDIVSPNIDLQCHASITYPTNDYKNCVSILFTKYNAKTRMSAKSRSKILTLHLAAHQVNCKQYFKNCRLMSMPVQLLSEYIDTNVSESLHLTWYQDFLPEKKRNFEEIKFITQLMANKTLKYLSLPCEALSIEQFSPDKHWMVEHIEFTSNDINPNQDRCKEYMTQITGYLLHIHSKTLTLPPFCNAFFCLVDLLKTEFAPIFLNQLFISGSKTSCDVLNFNNLVGLMGQLPRPWLHQMDADGEGNISFSLRTEHEYEDDECKYTVTRVKDGLQRKINFTIISFCFGLRELSPCQIKQLITTLRIESLKVDVFYIFPELMFANPYTLQIITGLKEVTKIKMLSFDEEPNNNNLSELHMFKKNTLKVFDLAREQLMFYAKTLSRCAHITKQSCPSHVKLYQIDYKNVTDLSTVLLNQPNLSILRIVDYFYSSENVDKAIKLCDQQNTNCKSLETLTFKSKTLLTGDQVVTLLKLFPNLQKVNLSGLQNMETFFEAVLSRTILSTGVLSELNLGECNLKFPNSGTLIAKFLLSSKNLKILKVTTTDSKMSASVVMEMVLYIDCQNYIIHNRQLRVLNFGKCRFDGIDAVKVGKMCSSLLFHFPKLQSIDMSMFRTGKSTLISFFTALNEHHKDKRVCCEIGLRHLDLSGHYLKSREMTLFLEALKKLPNLSELRLERCRIRANPVSFVDKVCKFSMIDLSRCYFKSDHKKHFVAQVIRFASTDTKLRMVGSKECFLNSLAKELESTGIKSTLGHLDLSNSNLCNVNLDFLVTSLIQLKTLVLKNCHLDATVLKNQVCKHRFASLTTLDMSSSKFHKPESGKHLVSVLEQFPSLLELKLLNCGITVDVMEQLLQELKRRQLTLTLRNFDLLNNQIKSSDIIVLLVARYLPLGCKVKVNSNPKQSTVLVSQLKKYFNLDVDDGNNDDNVNMDCEDHDNDNVDSDYDDHGGYDDYNDEYDDYVNIDYDDDEDSDDELVDHDVQHDIYDDDSDYDDYGHDDNISIDYDALADMDYDNEDDYNVNTDDDVYDSDLDVY